MLSFSYLYCAFNQQLNLKIPFFLSVVFKGKRSLKNQFDPYACPERSRGKWTDGSLPRP